MEKAYIDEDGIWHVPTVYSEEYVEQAKQQALKAHQEETTRFITLLIIAFVGVLILGLLMNACPPSGQVTWPEP